METANADSISIVELEAAINYWRARRPSPDGVTLASELRALAEVYATMIYFHQSVILKREVAPGAMNAIEDYRLHSHSA